MAANDTITRKSDNSTVTTEPPKKRRGGSDTLKKAVMWVLGVVIVLGFAYGSGMRSQLHKLHAKQDQINQARDDAKAARIELASAEAISKQLEARRLLHRTLMELDNRNFGSAQEHLQNAAALLREADAASPVNFSALAGRIAGINLEAASDISGQRAQVLALTREMDTALAASVPKPSTAANSGASPSPSPTNTM